MMPPESEAHKNQPGPPGKQEALQYITYSAKELLYMLNEKVEGLDSKLDAITIEHAKLDSRYVTQKQYDEGKRQVALSVRFAVASVIASVGALGTFIGIIVM